MKYDYLIWNSWFEREETKLLRSDDIDYGYTTNQIKHLENVIKFYGKNGWELTSTSHSLFDGITLIFKKSL